MQFDHNQDVCYFNTLHPIPIWICITSVLADFLGLVIWRSGPEYNQSCRHKLEKRHRDPSGLPQQPRSNPSSNAVARISPFLGHILVHDPAATEISPFLSRNRECRHGTHKVDETASTVSPVSPNFTLLAGLLELKAPIGIVLLQTISHISQVCRQDTRRVRPVYSVKWDEVTLSALAAEIAGVPRDGFPNPSDILYAALAPQLSGLNQTPLIQHYEAYQP